MYNVIIRSNDKMFCHGLMFILSQAFKPHNRELVFHFDEMENNPIPQADIIVMKLARGEERICHPYLFSRNDNSIVIAFYEGDTLPINNKLPMCFNNTLFIKCTETVTQAVKAIQLQWPERKIHRLQPFRFSCYYCKYRLLSAQQLTFVDYFIHGMSTKEIGRNMGIMPKTVAAHKRMVMRKFNVDTDCDLLKLLHLYKSNHSFVASQTEQQ